MAFFSEGKVVRYYRHPNIDGQTVCKHCGNTMHNHGWIDTPRRSYYPVTECEPLLPFNA